MRIWHGRHAAPLIIIWLIAFVAAAIVYRIQEVQPALAELMRPLYVIVCVVALFITWKWFRARAAGSHEDRRHGDRRHNERRDDVDAGH